MSEKIRNRKHEAHTWFDKLWNNHIERDMYYRRLGKEMNLSYEDCHFSKMNDEQLEQAIEIIKKMWLEKFDK